MENSLLAKEQNFNDSTASNDVEDSAYEEPPTHRKVVYDLFLWLLSNIFDCFFREIRSRGRYKIPTQGPVIFVAAPHANQFIDPVILMGQVKKAVNKRVSFLVAEKSLSRKAIGTLARCAMSIGVGRAQDNLKIAAGKIMVSDDNSRKIIGRGTKFAQEFEAQGLIGLPKSLGNAVIESIESDTVLYIRKEFRQTKPEVKLLLTKGTSYKYAPKVDQKKVYHRVFEHLAHDQCVGIFPEGGSHDRTDLLPLKAGVAIMALGCMSKHPEVNVQIVPCGMNYFHPHKFRSRAVVEFGNPIEITPELLQKYRESETNKDAVKELLDKISGGLKAVTVTCPDYETLMVVQAARRLYAGHLSAKLPLSLVIEMNRRLVKGYQTYREDPRIKQLKEDVLRYNANLRHFNIPDHQVESAKINFAKNLGLLVIRSLRLSISLILALPGIIMFSPVFIVAKVISKKKATQALAASTVKIKANDVIATWKILIGMGFAPLLYTVWSVLLTYYFRNSITRNKFASFIGIYILCTVVTYSALIIGDNGMDVFKSLRPLYLSITTPGIFKDLQNERRVLEEKITEMVNTLGPELYPGFDGVSLSDKYRNGMISSDEDEEKKTNELKRRRQLRKRKESGKQISRKGVETDGESDALSMINSDNSLSNIPLFSNMGDRSGSVSSLTSFSSGFEVIEDMTKTDELSGKIAHAVREKRD
ncbi:LANO_0F07712g1_1 [Lachancea nothofagi CBS 11611]|uniref:LANO_0F07712g1_1 n=1 Tax=Lachancea nothofagi CBS 11611 TaxID=1266666 RepID=A0A1G4K949_9SACH|nr:LANO_0F07712g1_1 [Lachancea nothofagi CBS 11611]